LNGVNKFMIRGIYPMTTTYITTAEAYNGRKDSVYIKGDLDGNKNALVV